MILFCFLTEGLNTRFDKANDRLVVEKVVFRVFVDKTSYGPYKLTDIRSVLYTGEDDDPEGKFRKFSTYLYFKDRYNQVNPEPVLVQWSDNEKDHWDAYTKIM